MARTSFFGRLYEICLLKVKPTLTEEQRTAIAGELEETIVGCGRLWTAVPWGVVVFR